MFLQINSQINIRNNTQNTSNNLKMISELLSFSMFQIFKLKFNFTKKTLHAMKKGNNTIFDDRLAELQEGDIVSEWVGRVVLRVEDDLGDLDVLRRIRTT